MCSQETSIRCKNVIWLRHVPLLLWIDFIFINLWDFATDIQHFGDLSLGQLTFKIILFQLLLFLK